jgi:hypothetical protein
MPSLPLSTTTAAACNDLKAVRTAADRSRKKLGAEWMIVGEGGVTQAGGLASWLVLYLVSPDTSSR